MARAPEIRPLYRIKQVAPTPVSLGAGRGILKGQKDATPIPFNPVHRQFTTELLCQTLRPRERSQRHQAITTEINLCGLACLIGHQTGSNAEGRVVFEIRKTGEAAAA